MAKDSSSPFSPGRPVPLEFFVGRRLEMERLDRKVARAAKGLVEVEFLVGERGIGKSSLASIARSRAENEHQALGVHTYLSGAASLEDAVRSVFDRLLNTVAATSLFEKVKGLFGKYIRKVELFSLRLEFAPPEDELRALVHNFAAALRAVIDKIRDDKKLLFPVFDDLNGLAHLPAFANWLKSLVDEMATSSEPHPVFLLLVGIDERRHALIGNQPSLDRVLDPVDVNPWTAPETRAFYHQAFLKVGMTIEESALTLLTHYAGGLPVLAHEIGDAAFTLDEDGHVDHRDAVQAVSAAAAIVGRKYLQPKVMAGLKSRRYRSILGKVTRDPLGFEFQRGDVPKKLSEEEGRVLDNFLRRLVKLGVISKDPDRGPGAYRFTNVLHHVYFWMQATPVAATPA
jgi:LmbE family N-acetylglucosaminyl deacetylase